MPRERFNTTFPGREPNLRLAKLDWRLARAMRVALRRIALVVLGTCALWVILPGMIGNGQGGGYIEYGVGAGGELAPGGIDEWTFDVSDETRATALHLVSDEFDTVLELYAKDGSRIVSSDDDGGGSNSGIVTSLQPGEYTLTVRGFDPAASGRYSLNMHYGLLPYEPFIGNLEHGEQTVLLFLVTAPGVNTVQLRSTLEPGAGGFDTVLSLFGPDSISITSDDDGWPEAGPGTDSQLSLTLAEPGVYAVLVSSYDNAPSGEFEITLYQ